MHGQALLYSVVLGLDRSLSLPWGLSRLLGGKGVWEWRLPSHMGSRRQVEWKGGLVCRSWGESLTVALFSCLTPQ